MSQDIPRSPPVPVPVPVPAPAPARRAEVASTPVRTGHLEIRGVRYYFEVHGRGEPLLLLHGGLGSIEMMAPVLPALAARREVIAVDLHGHGRTALGERKIRYAEQGDDMAALLTELGYGAVDVMGYSFGGGVSFRLASQHVEKVRRLVLVSIGCTLDAFFPEIRGAQERLGRAMAPLMNQSPLGRTYAAVAPRAEFPELLDAMGELIRTPYDWSEDVTRLAGPVMLVYADHDTFRPEREMAFWKLLGGGLRDAGWDRAGVTKNRLAILPGATHYDLLESPLLVPAVLSFLDGRDSA